MYEGAAAPSYSIRSGGMYAARSGPSGRFLYHFPAVTEGDRKMMQLEKMKILNVHCKCNRRKKKSVTHGSANPYNGFAEHKKGVSVP